MIGRLGNVQSYDYAKRLHFGHNRNEVKTPADWQRYFENSDKPIPMPLKAAFVATFLGVIGLTGALFKEGYNAPVQMEQAMEQTFGKDGLKEIEEAGEVIEQALKEKGIKLENNPFVNEENAEKE
ncbi:MAG: hypothetical protein A2Y25_04160 [Candidatus Melainabacteria bacterium GWF2_37_15]|nr:MAG: hypothetical protein A2Y25_04160 [Candidatus Melainabacteria bacterium GWF2_37_15]